MKTEINLKNGITLRVTAKNKRKSNKWGQEHYAYTIVIDNGRGVTWKDTYHDSAYNMAKGKGATKEMLLDAVGCMVMDAYAYLNHKDNAFLFLVDYGYGDEEKGEGMRAYFSCQDTYGAFEWMVGKDGLEELYEAFA